MKYVVTALACVALVGCNEIATEDSDNIKTSGIDAHYQVTNDGQVFTVRAELTFGDDEPTHLSTSGGDELTATFGGQTKTLREKNYWHEAEFALADGDLTIDFNRTEFLSATGSSIALSSTTAFTSPAEGDSFVYSSTPISMVYPTSATENYERLVWNITCIEGSVHESRTGSTDQGLNGGSVLIPMSTLFSGGPQILDFPTSGCTVVFTLEKDVEGTVSNEFNSGRFEASIDSTISVIVTAP